MLQKIGCVVGAVWRGAWRVQYPLNPKRRLWHYVDYVSWRLSDYVAAIYVFVFPFAIGFFVAEHYARKPTAVVAVTALLAVLWAVLTALAYCRGREPPKRPADPSAP